MKSKNNIHFAYSKLLLITSLGLLSNTSHATHPRHHHNVNAPIGIMGDHLMGENEWMISYRFMNMGMAGNRTGTKRVTTPLPGFMVSPLKMNMNMNMLGAMYGITNNVTVMTMLPTLAIDMDHVINSNGVNFNTAAEGIGDIQLSVNWNHQLSNTLINAGVSIPTGSINEKNVIPVSLGVPVQLPYPMQHGSGTTDLLLGLTKSGHLNKMNWGAQAKATLRIGENDNGYTLGNEYTLTTWIGSTITESTAGTVRIDYKTWGNIDGADTTLAAAPTVPTKNTNLRGGTRINAIFGVDTTIDNHVLGLEIGFPLYQDLNGPQLELDSTLTLGWQVRY